MAEAVLNEDTTALLQQKPPVLCDKELPEIQADRILGCWTPA